MNFLVTGGAGYLGSILVSRLLEEGHCVTVLDNFLYRQRSLSHLCHFANLEIIKGDVRNKRELSSALKKADYIFPLACITGAPACDQREIEAREVNFEAINLLLSLRSKNQSIIYPNTNSGYGKSVDGEFCTEKSPLMPKSLYGRLKVQAEREILSSAESISLRLATVFGASPRMRTDLMVNDFVFRAFFDRSIVLFESHFRRNFLYIGDAINAFLHCVKNFENMKNEPYNVGLNRANLTKMQLCLLIKEFLPNFHVFESSFGKDPDQRDYLVSNDKIKSKGFVAKISLETGIKELVKACQIPGHRSLSNVL